MNPATTYGRLASVLLRRAFAGKGNEIEALIGDEETAVSLAERMATIVALCEPEPKELGLYHLDARPPYEKVALHWSVTKGNQQSLIFLGVPDWQGLPTRDGDMILRITGDDWRSQPFETEDLRLELKYETGQWTLSGPRNAEKPGAGGLKAADLVVQGGLTSGVVYPKAIAEISRRFEFRRVGGTSAGAIAAAFAAAAEYRRLTTTTAQGFRELNTLASDLSSPDSQGVPLLRRLFQPQKGTAHLFNLLSDALQPNPAAQLVRRIWKDHGLLLLALIVGALLLSYDGVLPILLLIATVFFRLWTSKPVQTLTLPVLLLGLFGLFMNPFWKANHWSSFTTLSSLEGLGTAYWKCNFFGLLLLTYGVVGLISSFVRDVLVRLPRNDHGLCSGYLDSGQLPAGSPRNPTKPLTEWLAEQLDSVAGLDSTRMPPLTFGHLRRPQELKMPDWRMSTVSGSSISLSTRQVWLRNEPKDVLDNPEKWCIDLRLFTTCLGLQRPYTLPMDTDEFGILQSDLHRFFPPRIALYVQTHARWTQVLKGSRDLLIGLPDAEDLPVVVAVRLSLSFPVLFSAVPIYLKHTHEKMYFSDGGLTSNFPMTLFDEPVPDRPVLALNLTYRQGTSAEVNQWNSVHLFDPQQATGQMDIQPTPSLTGFLSSIFDTARLWFDRMSLNTPGMRERVAQIDLYSGDGGLNLNMSPETIDRLAERGRLAGDALARRFATSNHPLGFYYHQGIRATLLSDNLKQLKTELPEAYNTEWDMGVLSLHPNTHQVIHNLYHFNCAANLMDEPVQPHLKPRLRFRPPFSR